MTTLTTTLLKSTNFTKDYQLEGNLLKIHTYPDPILKKVAAPVKEFDENLATLCKDMLYTMYLSPGIGLAAPQIGLGQRIFVIDVDYDREKVMLPDGKTDYELSNFNPLIFINPVIRQKEGEVVCQEGCLSLPGIYEEVKRYEKIIVDYCDLDGTLKTIEATDLLAICIQHENDHLDGIVFLDRLPAFKGSFLKKKLIARKKKSQKKHSL